MIEEIKQLKVSEIISDKDLMILDNKAAKRNYFYTGRSNLLTIFELLNLRHGYLRDRQPLRRILDYGSGYGRVARWLRVAFPEAEIHVTDRNMEAAKWCEEHLGCTVTDLDAIPDHFDLVWVGSVFTHLDGPNATSLLGRLLELPQQNGLLAITTHGRIRVARMRDYDWELNDRPWLHFRLGRERWSAVSAEFTARGYGYVDYPGEQDYGMCIASPDWYARCVLERDDYIRIMCGEIRDNFQDVSAFMRRSIYAESRGPLW